MSIEGKTIVELAADLAAGAITQQTIRSLYGDSVLTAVLGIGGGVVAGFATNYLLEALDRETGIVSDLGSLVDDVLDIF
jgi:hypothetical protein